MDEGAKDSLLWIEEHLPERFELLLRTNREYDKRSGVHGGMWYLHLVECIKGKIHCSCPSCSPKTNNRGRYGSARNYTHSDLAKVESMQCKVSEYKNGEECYEND